VSFKPRGRKSIPDELINFGYHLVYSEGLKTEKNYINEIKACIANKYMVSPNDINVIFVSRDSYNTKSLVENTIEDVKRRSKTIRIDHVWIFFDKDDFPKDQYDSAIKIISNRNDSTDMNTDGFYYEKETGITWHECHSNEAFELWYCLYFDYLDSKLTRHNYIEHLENIKSLKAMSFKYNKIENNIHSILIKNGGDINRAIRYAKKLESINKYDNPSTSVYKFVEYFKPYFK